MSNLHVFHSLWHVQRISSHTWIAHVNINCWIIFATFVRHLNSFPWRTIEDMNELFLMNPRFETSKPIFYVVFTHWIIFETILDYLNHFCGWISNLMFLQRKNQFQWILDLDWNLSVSYLSETQSLNFLWNRHESFIFHEGMSNLKFFSVVNRFQRIPGQVWSVDLTIDYSFIELSMKPFWIVRIILNFRLQLDDCTWQVSSEVYLFFIKT